ncbi:hypothetical protein [uncultured Erythrobacter sp.]|uniref:hypothetical protein n=1 Tax=uncultured Erythrobacter sp. TaxID=263913 RepID=UPI002638DA9F|nr:hypothetical protein [uncultured Erythrobacter sp.]
MKLDVLMALLALDSYNRGYAQQVKDLPDIGNIGPARILRISDTDAGSADFESGFYALAYNWNGETIISYRGTNFFDFANPTPESVQEFTKDLWGGWNFFFGFERPSQADLARAFYEDVTGNTFRGEDGFVTPPDFGDNRITLTGHSLRDGLVAHNDNVAMEKTA